MSIKTKFFAGIGILGLVAVGGYWYGSPYLAMKATQTAAQTNDAETFNEHVDYPLLRESIKGQMAAVVSEQMGDLAQSKAGAAGAALGLAMLGPMVDAFVRPEMMMKAMSNGKMLPKPGEGSGSSSADGTPKKELKWDFTRNGPNTVVAVPQDPSSTTASPGFVFKRYGFADWKLTEIRLPSTKPV
jgi:hypothetical protein